MDWFSINFQHLCCHSGHGQCSFSTAESPIWMGFGRATDAYWTSERVHAFYSSTLLPHWQSSVRSIRYAIAINSPIDNHLAFIHVIFLITPLWIEWTRRKYIGCSSQVNLKSRWSVIGPRIIVCCIFLRGLFEWIVMYCWMEHKKLANGPEIPTTKNTFISF